MHRNSRGLFPTISQRGLSPRHCTQQNGDWSTNHKLWEFTDNLDEHTTNTLRRMQIWKANSSACAATGPDYEYFHRSNVCADTSPAIIRCRAILWIYLYAMSWRRCSRDAVGLSLQHSAQNGRGRERRLRKQATLTPAKQKSKRYNSKSKHRTLVKSKTTNREPAAAEPSTFNYTPLILTNRQINMSWILFSFFSIMIIRSRCQSCVALELSREQKPRADL